eukprot:TRINITY_DN11140_c0_g2_i1.p1 TRINITY_DN11140_c0_g2~~TRINITY_DN11140_c0_g2_i1.p1  ORF type:complete len:196 (+),score=16.77 TRINITY_DN11140_c0_g2_i1:371-958(+)
MSDQEEQLNRPGSPTGSGGAAGGSSREYRPPEPWSMRMHHVIVGTAMFSSILLLMIIVSRSWGVGHDRSLAMSAGIWEVCLNDYQGDNICKSWSSFCSPAATRVVFAGVFSIISLITAIFIVLVDGFEMMRPTTLRIHHPLVTTLSHLLWVFLLLSWALFSGAMVTTCGDTKLLPGKDVGPYKPNTHMWYDERGV